MLDKSENKRKKKIHDNYSINDEMTEIHIFA